MRCYTVARLGLTVPSEPQDVRQGACAHGGGLSPAHHSAGHLIVIHDVDYDRTPIIYLELPRKTGEHLFCKNYITLHYITKKFHFILNFFLYLQGITLRFFYD